MGDCGYLAIQRRLPQCATYQSQDGFTAVRGFLYGEKHSPAREIHHAYHSDSHNVLSLPEGQFLAAGYDRRRNRFWAVADTFGCRPMFYFERDGVLCFSDSLTALLARFGDTRPCAQSIHAYFSLLHIPAPWTGFRGIRQLPPNSILLVDNLKPTMRTSIWSPRPAPLTLSQPAAVDFLEAILRDRVSEIASCGCDFALLFSGGVDSTLLGSLLQECCEPGRVVAHSLGGEAREELEKARERAKWLGVPFRSETFPSAAAEPSKVTRRWRAPVFSFPAVYVDWFCERVGSQAPHLVSGSGADGIFLADDVLCRLLCRESGGEHGRGSSRRSTFLATSLFRPVNRFARRFLYTPEFLRCVLPTATESLLVQAGREAGGDPAAALLFQYLLFARPSIMSVYTSAVHGASAVHFPFLSKKLIEFVLALPLSLRLGPRQNGGKPLLKALLLRRAPMFPVDEPKSGFGHSISINEHFSPTVVARRGASVLRSGLCDFGILCPDAVGQVFAACSKIPRDPELLYLAWGIYSLSVWFRQFFGGTRDPLA